VHYNGCVTTTASTREAILDATDRLMERYGFRKMTMEDLAREARVSRRTIYLHFKSKEDVGLSSIGRVVENVHRELERIAASPDPAPRRLRLMLDRRVMGRIEQIRNYAHSLDELFEVVRPAYMARRRMYFDREAEMIAGVLEAGREDGSLEFPETAPVAEALLRATNAFLPYSLSVRELGEPAAIRARLATMIDLLLRGLRPGAPIASEGDI
jgi:AcrR family transcriptional regulator